MSKRLAWPLRLDPETGMFATVVQHSEEDIEQCLRAISRTTPGDRWDAPGMGVDALEFGERPLDTGQIAAALATYEPRTTREIIERTPAFTGVVDGVVAELTAEDPDG